MTGPTFICIGAIKSGTTWLHYTLQQHPGVWLPPLKELRYFNEPEYNLSGRLFGKDKKRYEYWRIQVRNFSAPQTGLATSWLFYVAPELFFASS